MHPILFRIPLPQRPLMIWWALVLGAIICAIYAGFARKNGEKGGAAFAALLGVGALVAAYVYRAQSFEAPYIPIYSYGVMLGLSLVVGWYLTLTLAERDGLPKETMANCYVFTAIAAIAGSRVLYVLTNLDEFHSIADMFAFRRGGLVAYGGFLGGYLGSWAYLRMNKIRLMPWADVAVPSLASGLMVTRVGCYLFGCDFGKSLPSGAPAFLQKLGTFPHWVAGTLDNGDGSPAYVRQLDLLRGTPQAAELVKRGASFPVHPTQIYESLCGVLLLTVLLWQRKNQKFRGQIFFTFVFGYGFLRFLLEIIRDDVERGEWGPMMAEHVIVPFALLLMSVGFCFGIALGIKDATARTVARVVSFLPPIVAYLLLKPASFGGSTDVMLSTSQWIALATALAVSFFYAQFWQDARKNPRLAMSLGPMGDLDDARADRGDKGDDRDRDRADDEVDDDDDHARAEATRDEDEDTSAESPRPKKTREKKLVKKKKGSASARRDRDAAAGEAKDAAASESKEEAVTADGTPKALEEPAAKPTAPADDAKG